MGKSKDFLARVRMNGKLSYGAGLTHVVSISDLKLLHLWSVLLQLETIISASTQTSLLLYHLVVL